MGIYKKALTFSGMITRWRCTNKTSAVCPALTHASQAALNKRYTRQTFQSGSVKFTALLMVFSRQRAFLKFLVAKIGSVSFSLMLSSLPCPGRLFSSDHAPPSPTACGNTDHFIISHLPLQEAAFILSNTQKITVKGSHFMENMQLATYHL